MKKANLLACCVFLCTSVFAQNVKDHRGGEWSQLAGTAKDVTVNEKGVVYRVGVDGILSEFTVTGWSVFDNQKLRTYSEYASMGIKVLSNGLMERKVERFDGKTHTWSRTWEKI